MDEFVVVRDLTHVVDDRGVELHIEVLLNLGEIGPGGHVGFECLRDCFVCYYESSR